MAKTPTSPDKPIDTPTPSADAGQGGPAPVVTSDAELVSVAAAGPVGGLGEAAAALGAPAIPVPVGGQGVGANRIAEPELGVRSQPLDARTADPRGPVAGYLDRYATGYADAATLPFASARTVVDPDAVPGTHMFEALTRIMHDGRTYEPGEDIELDFRSYEQLVSIGAIAAIDWHTGEPIRLAPSPGAPRY